jgi:hypothetical protein
VRAYQLKDTKAFEQASYSRLLDDDRELLKVDLAGSMEAVLGPGATVKLSAPMADEVQAVGVGIFPRSGRRHVAIGDPQVPVEENGPGETHRDGQPD